MRHAASVALLLLATQSIFAAPRPWVLRTPVDVAVPLPPEQSTATEAVTASPSDIAYWKAGAPGYRWNALAFDLFTESDAPVVSERVIAALHIAIYDATIAAAHHQHAFQSKHYPSIDTAATGAASTVLTWFFPDKASSIAAHARTAVSTLPSTGGATAAGLALGREVGARVVERLRNDGSDKPWQGTRPATPGIWNGANPMMPQIATWKPWVLRTPDALRPPAPPSFDEASMAEVRDPANLTGTRKRAAFLWAITSLLRYFNEQASLKMFEEGIDDDPVRAAEIYATLNAAYYDALIAVWDAKYQYWGIRPNQFDTAFKSQISTPSFPGYPSGHAIFAGVATTILTHYFPRDRARFEATAAEIANSRLWGGVHFKVDNEVGLTMGRAVAAAALQRLTAKERP